MPFDFNLSIPDAIELVMKIEAILAILSSLFQAPRTFQG
jgi:hypothetical protein